MPTGPKRRRFAPSTTGPAHPGTLLAALLAWLDARSVGAHFLLRLEDLDPQRCLPQWAEQFPEALAWFGLDWDQRVAQSDLRSAHESALDHLASAGVLYQCECSRATIKALGKAAPGGGWAYGNACRQRVVTPGTWKESKQALRARLPDARVSVTDVLGADLSQAPTQCHGDPIVRRRDGAVAYNLAVVVDDGSAGIDRVVRGRDIAQSTATQVALTRILGLEPPQYLHHLLLMEARPVSANVTAEPVADPSGRSTRKLAKLHGAVGIEELRQHYSSEALCGVIAHAAGLVTTCSPTTPAALLPEFSWENVGEADRVLGWDGRTLALEPLDEASV